MGLKILHVLIIAVCLCGMTAATLAFGEHYNTNPSPCQINSHWDCGIVNHSPFAVLHGVPIALIGVLGYGLLIGLVGRAPWLAFAGAAAGCAFALRFSYVEWKVLETWCLYCVSSQIMIATLVPLTYMAARMQPAARGRR